MTALTPRDAVPPAETRTLLALLDVYRRDGRATVRSVAAAAGLSSISTIHGNLAALADRGLVASERARSGTLRPLVEVVPWPAR